MSSLNQFIQGIYPAVFTPFNEDGTVDVVSLEKHCLDMLNSGCQGVVLFGTSGEGPSVTQHEKIQTYRRITSNPNLPSSKVLLGNGASSLFETIELVKRMLFLFIFVLYH